MAIMSLILMIMLGLLTAFSGLLTIFVIKSGSQTQATDGLSGFIGCTVLTILLGWLTKEAYLVHITSVTGG